MVHCPDLDSRRCLLHIDLLTTTVVGATNLSSLWDTVNDKIDLPERISLGAVLDVYHNPPHCFLPMMFEWLGSFQASQRSPLAQVKQVARLAARPDVQHRLVTLYSRLLSRTTRLGQHKFAKSKVCQYFRLDHEHG